MESTALIRLVRFLQEEIGIPATAIVTAKRAYKSVVLQNQTQTLNLLPVILWQYGLVTLKQLDQILDWLAST